MASLASRVNLKEMEENKIGDILNKRKKKDNNFKEQQLKNQEDLMIKQYKKRKVEERVNKNQSRMSVIQKRIFSSPSESRNCNKNKRYMTPRNIQVYSNRRMKEEEYNSDEEYENKHIKALTNKVKKYIEIVTKISKTNSEREKKVKISRDLDKKRQKNLILKAFKNMDKQEKARKKASENLKDQVYRREYLKTQKYKRFYANMKKLKIREVKFELKYLEISNMQLNIE